MESKDLVAPVASVAAVVVAAVAPLVVAPMTPVANTSLCEIISETLSY